MKCVHKIAVTSENPRPIELKVSTPCTFLTLFYQLNAGFVYFKFGSLEPALIWSWHLIGARVYLRSAFFFFSFYGVDLLSEKIGRHRTIF